MLVLASDSSGVLPKTLCSSLMVHVLYPSHICSACPVPQTEAALLLRSALLLAVLVSVPVSRCSDPGQHQPVFPATGLIPFSNHHPILHTLLFSLFYHIGFFLTGSINTGIACYVLFQMCTMAAIETYTLSLLARSGASRLWLILSFCFLGARSISRNFCRNRLERYSFFPDLCCYIFAFYMNCSATRITVRAFGQGFPFPAFFVCTLRSNGLYIFLFTLPFVLFAFRRTWKKCLPCRSAYYFYP